MGVNVGDRVQIKNGGIDVTNGKRARAGYRYGEGGPDFATVEAIVENWNTGGRWGLPNRVTKVRCSNQGVVVWQVQPQDIANQKVEAAAPVPAAPPPPQPKTVTIPSKPLPQTKRGNKTSGSSVGGNNTPYAIVKESQNWNTGTKTSANGKTGMPGETYQSTQVSGTTAFVGDKASSTNMSYKKVPSINRKKASIPSDVSIDGKLYEASFSTIWQDKDKKNEMLNKKKDIIQNQYGFPYYIGQSGNIPAKYDYRILIGDPRFKDAPTYSLEDKLTQVRAEFGIPVHGVNRIAKSIKHYMYNRFKVIDINSSHNKTFTHVFFTRPDLNILRKSGGSIVPVKQVTEHTEAALLWRRYPDLFKLLVDCSRCGDSNNFNLLLSNTVQSFDIIDETLSTNRVGKNWNEYEMQYGDAYTGRTAGEFSCNFAETADLEIITLMKLWITYIDNVARGAWNPSYNLNGASIKSKSASHVYTKTLDYASSAYVFKCGPDGEDILYWSKYYGVFPLNTGANVLSWDINNPAGDVPKPNIKFAYCYKRDLSPISLIEFNNIAKVSDGKYEPAYNVNLANSSRPFVGTPFVEISLGSPTLSSDSISKESEVTSIRLKFKKDTHADRTDDNIFRNTGRPTKAQINKTY